MKRLVLGIIIGLILGSVTSVIADGFAFNWTVTKNGRVICEDPWIWKSTKEIECD